MGNDGTLEVNDPELLELYWTIMIGLGSVVFGAILIAIILAVYNRN